MFGAQYCVYEDSGWLRESFMRIYPVMDRIVFLVSWEPWKGAGDRSLPRNTLRSVSEFPDPGNKVTIVAKLWKDEKDQRNEGLRILREAGCEWCMIVDDDEMFNRGDVGRAREYISNDDRGITAYMGAQIIYWKNRRTVIDSYTSFLPLFFSTAPGEVEFTIGRCCHIRSGLWHCLPPETILCHHLSYVRDDDRMRRKLRSFTHADGRLEKWFNDVWLRWTPEMTDLHPNPDNPSAFKRAVPAEHFPFRLDVLPQ